MQYRPEIDGLRALAVLAVIFSHAGFTLFSGGYVGVDVFFVISGYLITSIILNDLQAERFSLIHFYERRARRILPALFFVMLACLPFAWFWMLPEALEDFGKSLVKVNIFLSNVYFWQEADYFSANTQLMPLLHTWSLAVEEQFYVLFPLGLMLFYRARFNLIPFFVIAVIILSFGMARWFIGQDPVGTYYLLHTRAWELAIGALVALYLRGKYRLPNMFSQPLSWFGVMMIVYAIVVLDETTPFPGYWTLLPVVGTAFVIAFSLPNAALTAALSYKPFVLVGLMSYSAYLWHQPVFAFSRIRAQGELSVEIYIGLISVVLVLSYLTWRYIEQPFRNRQWLSRKQIFHLALLLIFLFIVVGKVFRIGDGLPLRFSENIQEILQWTEHDALRSEACRSQRKAADKEAQGCVYGDVDAKRVALIGDSHALALSRPLADRIRQGGWAMSEHTQSGCAPILGYGRDDCKKFNESLFAYLDSQSGIDTLIISAVWPLHFETTRFDNQEGGVAQGKTLNLPQYRTMSDQERIQSLGQNLKVTVMRLINQGKRVVLVYPIPEVGWHVPNTIAHQHLFDNETSTPLSTSYEVFKLRTARAVQQLDDIEEHAQLIRVRPEVIFCDSHVDKRCITQIEDTPLYFDDNHLNAVGAGYVADLIIEAMNQAGWF